MIPEQPPAPIKHSGFGIAAFVLSVLGTLGICLGLGLGAVLSTQHANPNYRLYTMANGLLVLGMAFCCIVGSALGIAGLTQRNRRKEFAVVGLILGLVAFVLIVLLVVVGLRMMR